MALPTSMSIATLGRHARAGVTVGIFPSTQGGLLELQISTAAAAATSLWQSVILPPSSAGVTRYRAYFNDSTRTYYFRARHPAQPGFAASSAFTPVISCKPKMLADML